MYSVYWKQESDIIISERNKKWCQNINTVKRDITISKQCPKRGAVCDADSGKKKMLYALKRDRMCSHH